MVVLPPGCDVAELTDDVTDIIAEHGRRIVSPISGVALWQMGGAVARVGEDETAFSGRGAGFTFNINGNTIRRRTSTPNASGRVRTGRRSPPTTPACM